MALKLKRIGWNGKNQYIQLATGISYKAADGTIVNCDHNDIGNKAIAFIGTSGIQMGWLATRQICWQKIGCLQNKSRRQSGIRTSSSAGQSNRLITDRSRVRVPGGPFEI